MNDLLKLTVVMFGALFLFACDSSSTAKKTPAGNSFFISAKVSGLDVGNGATLELYSGNDIKKFTKNETIQFDTKISEGSKYNIGITIGGEPVTQTCTIAANGSGDSMVADVVADVTCVKKGGGVGGNLSSVENGKIYYLSECAVCHRAGNPDPSSTFGTNGDLALDYTAAVNNNVEATFFTGMHLLGPKRNLMARFNNVKPENLADLKAYLLSVAP